MSDSTSRIPRNPVPMPVKHWSFAGLLLTSWCNARCASCYLCCGPDRGDEMSVESAVAFWHGLVAASPTGCRVHLTGGEPFGDWLRLVEVCRQAYREGLSSPGGKGPLEKIETNAFWATDEGEVRDRLAALDGAGLRLLRISADPYHQQFVPIERCRLLARVAEDVLGAHRVQVRWRDWLAEGQDTGALDEHDRRKLFAAYAAQNRDHWNGRAGEMLAEMVGGAGAVASAGAVAAVSAATSHVVANAATTAPNAGTAPAPLIPLASFADSPCSGRLLRSRHVHVDAQGRLTPGTCAGILLGDATGGIEAAWRKLVDDHDRRPIVGTLARQGPWGLVPLAEPHGYVPLPGYLGACHLCWHVRRHLATRGLYADELGPSWFYAV